MKACDYSSGKDIGKILLVGDIGRAFLDPDAISEATTEICANMLDAIDAAASESFAAVGIVVSGSAARLDSALKALRDVNSDARIILLAQMYQEPIAMQMVRFSSNGQAIADDYLICPMRFSHFLSHLLRLLRVPPGQVRSGQASQSAGDTSAAADSVGNAFADGGIGARVRQLEKLATIDDLTDLKNRRYIMEFSRQLIDRAKKDDGRVTLLMFDIDDFKHYNDVYGHLAGDEILKQVAVLMQRSCRLHDVVGRIGGDEFAVVFWDDPKIKNGSRDAERRSTAAEHPKEAIFVANRFRMALKAAELHLLGPEGKGVLTISGGLASFPRDGLTTEQLLGRADEALLDAKRSGKNRIYLVGGPRNDIADIE